MPATKRIDSARIRGNAHSDQVTFIVTLPDGSEEETNFWLGSYVGKNLLREFSRTGLLPTPDCLYYRNTSTFGRWMVKWRHA